MSQQDDLVARLTSAAGVVDAAELPADLRAAAFVLAFRESDDAPPSARPSSRGERRAAEPSTPPRQGGAATVRLADSLAVDTEVVERIFDVREDDVELILPSRCLDPSLRKAMTQVVTLTVAGRQGAGVETWTDVSVARQVCDHMGVLDTNFSRVLTALKGQGMRVRDGAGKPQINMNQNGFASAGALAKRFAEDLS